MFIRTKSRTGQTTLEYVILVAIVVAALLTIQLYMKRGIQGRMKSATDDIGDQFGTSTNATKIVTKHSNTFDSTSATGTKTIIDVANGGESTVVNDILYTNNSQQEYMP